MKAEAQGILLEIPEQPAPAFLPPVEGTVGPTAAKPKLKPIDREQGLLRPVIVDELVSVDHKVRAIWDLTKQLDLSGLYSKIKSQEGKAGSPAWDPQLLLSVWLYAYSEQVTSAREIARLMEYEPGLMWLSGLGEVNYHKLSEFRSQHPEELKQWMGELLGSLSKEGIVKLECVAHDSTKIQAQAGSDTFRRETSLEQHIAQARQMVEELDQQPEIGPVDSPRRIAARERAARERSERMKLAAEELEKIRAGKASAKERGEARVSVTEPEARIMKHGHDSGMAPSYNVQISVDSEQKVIVGMHLTQCSSDSGSLPPAMEKVKEMMGKYPQQVVADGGFTNEASIRKMSAGPMEFYGSLAAPEARQAASMKAAGIDPAFGPSAFQVHAESKTLQCPAGKVLEYVRQSQKGEIRYWQYQAESNDCQACDYQKQCCLQPEKGRLVSIRMSENEAVAAFREKMKTEAAQAIYKKRGPVAEFPNAWMKDKLGMRKFRLRGMTKAATEALWGGFTYNVQQWIRLSWLPKRMAETTRAGATA
jgi:transposase